MIYRPKTKYDRFTVLPNTLLRGGENTKNREDSIKPESLGVLVYLLSHKDDWRVTNRQIAAHFGISTSRVTTITNDLEDAGYLTRIRPVQEDGSVVWDWLVSDSRDPKIRDLKMLDLEMPDQAFHDLSNTISEEIPSVSNTKWKEVLCSAPPKHVSVQAWTEWWNHKIAQRKNRRPSQRMINMHRADFEALVAAGHRDFSGLVRNAINRDWQSIGKPDWSTVEAFKKQSDTDELLGAIR